MRCNSESIFFFLWHWSFPMLPWADISLVKCWICSSCFSMKTSQNCLWSCCQHGFLRISPGSCWGADSAVPLPWGPGGLCCHLLALQWPGGTNFRLCLCTLGYSCWHSRLHSPKASRVSKLWDYISHFLFSPHKVINERISAVNSLGCFIIYFHFFYNTPEHNLKLPLESTRLTVPFFSAW